MTNASALTGVLDQRESQYGHFVLEACLEKTATGYDNLFAKVTAIKAGGTKTSQEPLDFGSHVFAARRLERDEFRLLIEQASPTFRMDRYSFVLGNAQVSRSYPERMCSNNIWSEWPVDLFELRSGTGVSNYIPPKALVSHTTNRVFRDVYDGIDQWIGDKISNNSGWLRAVVVVLPDYRVRISELVPDIQKVTIRLVRNEGLLDLRVRGLIDGNGRQEIAEQVEGSETILRLNSQVDQIDQFLMFLTSPEGTIDYYEQNPLHHSGRIRWLAGSPERDSQRSDAELLTEIRKGEGLNLEFKPYVRIATGENKKEELIETAIAFANASGGTILVGVSNTGEIEGIERQLFHLTKMADLMRAGVEYGQEIRTMINDVTSTRLELEIQPVQLAGHVLLRIDVKELAFQNKPASRLDTKETWIRRGATNLRPDPETIRDEFARQPEGLGILGTGQPGDYT